MSRTNDISSDNFYTKGRGQRKAWPEGCIWPIAGNRLKKEHRL